MTRRGSRTGGGIAVIVIAVIAVVIWLGAGGLGHGGSGAAAQQPGSQQAGSQQQGSQQTGSQQTGSQAPGTSTAAAGSALALAQRLTVKGPAPLTGYQRVADFGEAWLDVDHDGCDTRDQVLARDLRDVRRDGCKVESGVLTDPYTRKVIDFVRGAETSEAVQIDHVVALADAWRTGAQALTEAQRQHLANDPIELLAVDGPTNQAKGDGDTATWLPPNKAFRCTYVAHQVAVKAAYHLWVTPAEQAAMIRVLDTCPTEPAPVSTLAG